MDTRSIARLFMEKDLETIEPGKLADLVVMDRDCKTIPEDDVLDIKSVMTMVGRKAASGRPERRCC